jgi:hypothetical protein
MKGKENGTKVRLFEIYGIPKEKRKLYSVHHIIFKSDRRNPLFKDFDVNKISNLCPLLRKEHRRLHYKTG